jgi:hypothetical protein
MIYQIIYGFRQFKPGGKSLNSKKSVQFILSINEKIGDFAGDVSTCLGFKSGPRHFHGFLA